MTPTEPAAYGIKEPASAQDGAADAEHRDDVDTPRPLLAQVLIEWASAIRFVNERPSSLRDHLLWARRGEWTEQLYGGRRAVELAHAYLVAIPVATVLFLVIWQTARLTRNLTLLALELTLAAVLNHLPFVHWLVPDVFDVTTWWISFLSLFGS